MIGHGLTAILVPMIDIIVIAHNLRSCHNVGALLRTAEGLGVSKVYLTGYTPYPLGAPDDTRLPHIARKLDAQIHKTALGAENSQSWQHTDLSVALEYLYAQGYQIAALEQAPAAIALPKYKVPPKIALVLGREVEGIEPEVLAKMDVILEIPMLGQKESFNVVQAAAMALFHLRFNAR
jgi:23S rRNA (guanosine2251-2'-O)-methyltransferase